MCESLVNEVMFKRLWERNDGNEIFLKIFASKKRLPNILQDLHIVNNVAHLGTHKTGAII